MTRSCQQGGAASLEDEVCRVPVVGLQVEEGRGRVGRLPQRGVAVPVTDSELVALLSDHDLVHLGKYSPLPD